MASGVSSTKPSFYAAAVNELLLVSAVTVCGLEKLRLVPFSDSIRSKQYPRHVQPPVNLIPRAFRPSPIIHSQHQVELYLLYLSRRGGTG
jgi:hypothetical protein